MTLDSNHNFTVTFAGITPPDLGIKPGSAEAREWLFNTSDLTVAPIAIERRSLANRPKVLSPEQLAAIKNILTERITRVIEFLHTWFDLKTNDWQMSPVVWQLLSFSDDVISSTEAPILDALDLAIENCLEILEQAGVMDPQNFMNSLDLVIHQVAARRNAIMSTAEYVIGPHSGKGDLLEADETHLLTDILAEVRRALTQCKGDC